MRGGDIKRIRLRFISHYVHLVPLIEFGLAPLCFSFLILFFLNPTSHPVILYSISMRCGQLYVYEVLDSVLRA